MLPIEEPSVQKLFRDNLKDNQVLILSADTGAGKSMQVPRMLLSYLGGAHKVVCTQPRQMPTVQVSTRVAYEMGVELGKEVGYQHRGARKKSSSTRLLFMTEGSLMRKFFNDNLQNEFQGFVLDEAHERNVETDVLLLFLRDLVISRPDARVVVMSATAETDRFLKYYKQAGIKAAYMHVPGRTNPIEHVYLKKDGDLKKYVPECVDKAIEICEQSIKDTGVKNDFADVIVFLPTKGDLEKSMIYLAKKSKRIKGYKLSADSPDEEAAIHTKPEESGYASHQGTPRKIIFSTNVAETSLTIPTLKYVVDSGLVIIQGYDPVTDTSFLEKSWVAKSNAMQRAGRAGRTQPGVAHHMYTKKQFDDFRNYDIPKVLTTDIGSLFLDVLSTFPDVTLRGIYMNMMKKLLDPPSRESLNMTITRLRRLKCIDSTTKITAVGSCVAQLNKIGPELAFACLVANQYDCLDSMLALACITTEIRRVDEGLVVDRYRMKDITSDVDVALRLFKSYSTEYQKHPNVAFRWAIREGLHARRWRGIMETYLELKSIVMQENIQTCVKIKLNNSNSETCTMASLASLIAYVFPKNVARWNSKKKAHELADGTPVQFSGSNVFYSLNKVIQNKDCRFLNLTRVMGKFTMAFCVVYAENQVKPPLEQSKSKSKVRLLTISKQQNEEPIWSKIRHSRTINDLIYEMI